MLIDVTNIVLIVFFFVGNINCEIFSSIERLEKLASDESTLLKELKIFANQVNNSYVNRKLKDWQDEHELVEKDVMHYITNPLNAFVMIKRATSDVKLIEQKYPEQLKEFLENTKDLRPGDDDLNGAVEGLFRLQTVYKLKSDDFANGIIDGQKTREPLSLHDLFIIGEEAFSLKDREYFAIEYLEMVWNKLNDGREPNREINENTLLLYVFKCYNRTGDFENAIKYIDIVIEKFPESPEYVIAKNELQYYKEKFGTTKLSMVDPFSDHILKDGTFQKYKEYILYGQVCRKDVTKSPAELSKLHCRYVSNSPFSKLARFKLEEANPDPYIVLYIDVLSDNEIEFLKTIAKPNSKPAKVFGATLNPIKSFSRVAQSSWHNDERYEVAKISRRVEDMTGLTQSTAESLQVQNYGIGGHYVPHWDHRNKEDTPFDGPGNRIATALFYLSDVEKGGATVFPYLKIHIPAQKGSAAFWYNVETTGESIYSTRHAGCPVILGNKWVANKWIREHGQEFRRPCLPKDYTEKAKESYFKNFF